MSVCLVIFSRRLEKLVMAI